MIRRRPAFVASALLVLATALIAVPAAAGASAPEGRGPAGKIFTVAGPGTVAGGRSGPAATDAEIREIGSVGATADGGFLLVDSSFSRWSIRRVHADGTVSTITTGFAGLDDFSGVGRLAVLPDGGFFTSDPFGLRILAGTADGAMSPIAGTGEHGSEGDGGPAAAATFMLPVAVAPTRDGGLLIADSYAHRIRRIAPSRTISTVAGTGDPGRGGDGGPATSARIAYPHDVAETADGGFLIADGGNRRIRRVDSGGTITTVAGRRRRSDAGGRPTRSDLGDLSDLAATRDGGYLSVDHNGHVLRIADTGVLTERWGTEEWTTPAGRLSDAAALGDGGPADEAVVYLPNAVAEAADGGVLIGESGGRVRYVAPESPRLLAVAAVMRRGRAGTGRYVAPYRTTKPARVSWRLLRAGTTVARGRHEAGSGLRRIRLSRALAPGVYILELAARRGAARATNRQSVFLGGRLPMSWARRATALAAPDDYTDDEGGGIDYRRRGCRRFGRLRVDCRWEGFPLADDRRQPPTEAFIVSVRLQRYGQIFTQRYVSSERGRPGPYRRDPVDAFDLVLVDLQCMAGRRLCG